MTTGSCTNGYINYCQIPVVLPRALEYLFEHFFGSLHERAQQFFDEIDKKDPNYIFSRVAAELDTRYGITAFVETHKNLALALINYSMGGIPLKKTDIPSKIYSNETFATPERDKTCRSERYW